jgi:hypothetical protein
VIIVERVHENQDQRDGYWSGKLGGNTQVNALGNILDFKNWD